MSAFVPVPVPGEMQAQRIAPGLEGRARVDDRETAGGERGGHGAMDAVRVGGRALQPEAARRHEEYGDLEALRERCQPVGSGRNLLCGDPTTADLSEVRLNEAGALSKRGESVRPMMRFAIDAAPLMFPVWRMCVYSCVMSARYQSS